MTIRLRTLLLAALIAGAAAIGTAVFVVWRGVYDISATEQHTAPVYQLLEVAMRRAVIAKGRSAPPPPAHLDNVQHVRQGAALYQAHCRQCHGAPGVAPDAFAFGLRPAPANLIAAGREWKPGEIFWVVKHGVKMTGMPAWEYRLADDEIWSLVAFVRAMPRMTVRQHAELAATLPPQPPVSTRQAQAAARPGDPRAGGRAAEQYLCATCHRIPGVVAAQQHVGPPLDGMARRGFIGGVLANTPENMVRWLLDPRAVDPLSAMPALGLTEQDARDIAAFLATLDQAARE